MYRHPMSDFRTIISLWPSLGAFADDIGVSYVTAQVAKHRNSVSPVYWEAMVAAARRRGIRGVTIGKLAKIRSARRPLGRARRGEPAQSAA
jgi:hypothetical protein